VSSARARLIAILVLSLSACHASGKTSSPMRPTGGGDRKDAERLRSGDDLDALQVELETASSELAAWQQGERAVVEAGSDEPTKAAQARPVDATTPQSRCERIAGLADRICGLRDAMCLLAQEHEGQARYSNACERAGQMCQEASEARDGCSE
jgi:hypothetical protein